VDHILRFLLVHVIPADLRQVFECGAEGFMILLPPHAFKDGVGVGKWSELELGRLLYDSGQLVIV